MNITKLKITNLKKYHGTHKFCFNDDINILVGDNDSGKSTLLEALEMVLNSRLHGQSVNKIVSTDLFNKDVVDAFLQGDQSVESLPEILIEAFFEDAEQFTTEAKLRGYTNSENADATGVFLRICFDPNLKEAYQKFLAANSGLKTLPIEFYQVEWFGFDWKPIHHFSANFRCIAIDPTRIHPTYGKHQYIKNTLGAIGHDEVGTLNLSFRQLQAVFSEQDGVKAINASLDAGCSPSATMRQTS